MSFPYQMGSNTQQDLKTEAYIFINMNYAFHHESLYFGEAVYMEIL